MSGPLKPLKWYRKLSTEKGRREAQAFLIEGERAVRQIADSHPGEIIEIVTTRADHPAYRDYPVRQVTERQFDSISSTVTPQGIIAVVRLPQHIYSDRLPDNTGTRVLLLEHVQDPGNAGTLIRTAAAFDYSGVILSDKCADPLSPKCVQATAGTVLSLWLRRTAGYMNLVDDMKKRGYSVIAADLNGEENPAPLRDSTKLVLALGSEASGLSQAILKVSDYRFRIPITREKVESLNVAASGAICMYLSIA